MYFRFPCLAEFSTPPLTANVYEAILQINLFICVSVVFLTHIFACLPENCLKISTVQSNSIPELIGVHFFWKVQI